MSLLLRRAVDGLSCITAAASPSTLSPRPLSLLYSQLTSSPDVEYCGYSAPHPSEPKIHLRVQMYEGLSAVDCLRRALSNLRDLYETIGAQYDRSLKTDKYVKEKDVDVHRVVAETLRERLGEDMDESA